jgi:hypothetical protein
MHVRDLAYGAWRVHLVVGDETHAVGVTRCGAPCFHLQGDARDEARLTHTGACTATASPE